MENSDFSKQICGYLPSLMQFASKFTKNEDDANDLVQDTMIKAIRYEDHYREGTNLRGWLFTIMKNTFINNYRALMRKTALIKSEDHQLLSPLPGSSSRNQSEEKFIKDDIDKAMMKLPVAYSAPFLRYFEGFKYHEIAIELDIPIGTVKTRIHFARKILQANLRMYHQDFIRQRKTA